MTGTVRCPYCVTGVEFRPMVAHVDGRHICNKCGHTTRPSDAQYECHCPNCRAMHNTSVIARIAARLLHRARCFLASSVQS